MATPTENRKKLEGSILYAVILSALAGVFIILGASVLAESTKLDGYATAAIACLVFAGCEAALFISLKKNFAADAVEYSKDFNKLMSEAVRNIESPVVITMVDGRIVWANRAMLTLCNGEKSVPLTGQHFEKYCSQKMSEIFSATKPDGLPLEINGRHFKALSYLLEMDDRDCWMTVLDETTELLEVKKALEHESPAIGYVAIDNLDEIAQYSGVPDRAAANGIELALQEWVHSMGGSMREFHRNQFIIIFPGDAVVKLKEEGFPILEKVRNISVGSGSLSVTVSMGISVAGSGIFEKEKEAAAALETAIQRGGDQVVLKTKDGTDYFGGKTKIGQKRNKIGSRVISERLIQLITDAGNVIVMGHKIPDFDCIGACIGISKLAKYFNPDVKIVADKRAANFRACTGELLRDNPEYNDIFIDGNAGLNSIRSDTLLIVCDVNNLQIVETPEIAAAVSSTVIIDHHRKMADFDSEPEIAYIVPAASSCSELVAEIFSLSPIGSAEPSEGGLSRAEANIMLSGIMLDTKNFTRTTGEGTYSAALYLKSAGASSEVARTFFYGDIDSFIITSKLGANSHIYRDSIAITVEDVEGQFTSETRISAANTAESLLTVRNISAAFVMLRNEDTVLISARSDGTVNVQLILEQLGGGGHFDSAGAQISGSSSRKVMESLRDAIDSYLDGNL